MKKLIIIVLCLFALNTYAQEQAPPEPWQHNVVGALALSQVRFRDWAKGGEDTLAWTSSLNGNLVNELPKTNWTSTYKFAFGQTKLGEEGYRKSDDKIDLETVLTYKLNFYVNPYVAGTLKTQFAKGFQYGEEGKETAVSKFFDPAYLTQSVGLGYQPLPQFKTRLGAAIREIITSEFNSSADDLETTEIEKTKVEGGIESVTNVEWQLKENILFTSKLELFAPIKTIDEVAIRNDSTIAVKVSKYVTLNFNVQIVKDKTLSEKTQVKEVITLGLSYTFL